MSENKTDIPRYGGATGLAQVFINSKITPLLIIATLLLGLFALTLTPREEEPQIVVPMIDVMVMMPGASPEEVENLVTRPMEQQIWEIEDVEYVDYKDVDLLSRFMSDRAKIRNMRVSGNDRQQQLEVAKAIKIAREMALLPYAKRVASTRTGGRGRDGGREGGRDRDTSLNDDVNDTMVDDEAIEGAESIDATETEEV